MPPDASRLEGIGELTQVGGCWRLVYDDCGDVQLFAHAGLEDPETAETYIRRDFAECLICRAAKTRPSSRKLSSP